jgi:predicted nuclease with RNAse H fold
MIRTHGIDLAVQPKNTAWATIDWVEEGQPVLGIKQASDGRADNPNLVAWLAQAIRNGERVGIDVPLGWPVGFREMVQQHAELGYRPLEHEHWEETYAGLRLRKTDEHVADQFEGTGKDVRPLSVSADKLGATAMRAAWLLGKLAGEYVVDRTGVNGCIIEVYPAAALAAWQLPHSGYKHGEGAQKRREEIWAKLGKLFCDAQPPSNDHQLDAVIAAIVARLASEISGPPREMHDDAKREGWIHVPAADSLNNLLEEARV